MSTYNPDILAINETWLRENETNLAPAVPNYTFIHRARKSPNVGGGVGFYIRDGLTTRVRKHPTASLEQLWLEVQLPGAKMALGTAYRPEAVGVQDAIDALSESVNFMGYCDYTCLLGDLNIDLNKADSLKAQELISFYQQHGLEQLVKEPTRITDHSETLLDVIMTDIGSKCKNILVKHNRCLSDHALVLVDFNIKKPKPLKRVKYGRSLHNINWDYFQKDLEALPWHLIKTCSNVDDMIEILNTNLLLLFNTHAPITKYAVKGKPKPWITETMKFMMGLRDKALHVAQREKSDSSIEYYRSFKNLVTATKQREKKAYFNSHINANIKRPSVLWRNLKNTVLPNNASKQIPQQLNDPCKINKYLLELPSCNKNDLKFTPDINKKFNSKDTFKIKTTNETTVSKIINNIKTKATGFDNISIDMIKLTRDVTVPVITHIINKSIELNTFPNIWKTALVCPIPKKNSVTSLKDLRPISILPLMSKIIEKVVLDQMLEYLDKNNIIPKFQSGFRRGHGTESALLHVSDDITEASERGLSSIMVLLDYSRAFDSLSHDLIVAKLEYYGFSKETCDWFASFLVNRKQIVVTEDINGEKVYSEVMSVERGVPQGSIISPILFLIFTADLPDCILSCKYHFYADDAQVYYSFDSKNTSEAVQKINDDLRNIDVWSKKNSLMLNPIKSQYLVLGTKKQIENVINYNSVISINNTALERVTSARNLGLIMDGEQKYEQHINEKIRNAFYKLKTLYRIRPYISEKIRVNLTDTLILSAFNYCCSVYGPRIISKVERAIQRVQNACIRFCFDIPRREFITPYINKKGILNMSARRELHYACSVHKVIWNKKPEYLFEKLSWISDVTDRSRRSATQNLLITQPHKTARYRGCFKFTAAKIWNNLPPPLRKRLSENTFKRLFKAALLSRQIAAESLKHAHRKMLNLVDYFIFNP